MTTISTVKALLVGTWSAALQDVQVVYGPLDSASMLMPKTLSVGDVSGRIELSSLGQESSTEAYTVNCLVSVGAPGYNQQTADDMCIAIFSDAVNAVRGMLLDNASITVSGDFEMREAARDRGRAAELTFPVAVFAVDESAASNLVGSALVGSALAG